MYQPDVTLKPTPQTKWYVVAGGRRLGEARRPRGDWRVGTYYFPFAQEPSRAFTIAVKSRQAAETVASAIAAQVAGVDRELALFDAKSMAERRIESLSSRSTVLALTIAFGALALFLAGVGIYGVISYLVAQRRREIGIRMALGSTQSGIWRLVMGESIRLSVLGVGLGLVLAFAIKRGLEREVYGVKPLDPAILVVVAAAILLVAMGGCLAPARRAARTDPARILVEG